MGLLKPSAPTAAHACSVRLNMIPVLLHTTPSVPAAPVCCRTSPYLSRSDTDTLKRLWPDSGDQARGVSGLCHAVTLACRRGGSGPKHSPHSGVLSRRWPGAGASALPDRASGRPGTPARRRAVASSRRGGVGPLFRLRRCRTVESEQDLRGEGAVAYRPTSGSQRSVGTVPPMRGWKRGAPGGPSVMPPGPMPRVSRR